MLIVPTYNERANIATVVRRVRAAAAGEPILFVDDNSPDGTAEEVRRIQQADPLVHLMVRPGKGGYGSACREGMQKIIAEGREPHVIQFDADLSHPAEGLPRMLELLRDNPVVIGSRYVKGGRTENWGLRRRMLSRGASIYARLLTGVPVRDMTSGFTGYQVAALKRVDLMAIRSEGYAFLMELKYALHRLGTKMVEFPITFSERDAGHSKFNTRILLEGVAYPARVLGKRMMGDRASAAH